MAQYLALDSQQKLAEHDIILKNRQSAITDLQRTLESITKRLNEEKEEGRRLELLEFVGESDERITQVTETEMDNEVPPPVPQVTIANYWSDSDDEVNEEKWASYQKSFVKKEVIEEQMDLGDSLELMFGVEEEIEEEVDLRDSLELSLVTKEEIEDEVDLGDSVDLMFRVEKEVENKLCEEDEFLNLELEGLPEYDEIGEFDSEGEHFFEALLEDIEVVVVEEHHSWPVVLITNVANKSKPQEKAKRRTSVNRNNLQVRRRST